MLQDRLINFSDADADTDNELQQSIHVTVDNERDAIWRNMIRSNKHVFSTLQSKLHASMEPKFMKTKTIILFSN